MVVCCNPLNSLGARRWKADVMGLGAYAEYIAVSTHMSVSPWYIYVDVLSAPFTLQGHVSNEEAPLRRRVVETRP